MTSTGGRRPLKPIVRARQVLHKLENHPIQMLIDTKNQFQLVVALVAITFLPKTKIQINVVLVKG